jgi:hypothetical protein
VDSSYGKPYGLVSLSLLRGLRPYIDQTGPPDTQGFPLSPFLRSSPTIRSPLQAGCCPQPDKHLTTEATEVTEKTRAKNY